MAPAKLPGMKCDLAQYHSVSVDLFYHDRIMLNPWFIEDGTDG